MNLRRVGFSFLVLLAACGQQQSLELQKDEVFSKQFSEEKLGLANDAGGAVTLKPMSLAASSGKGFTSTTPGSYYGQGCNSVYGCDQNPYSHYLGYSNMARSWNPAITRTINLNMGIRNINQPVLASFDPFAVAISSQVQQVQQQAFCVNLNVTSNGTLQVLRRGRTQVSGSGSNTVNIRAQIQRCRDRHSLDAGFSGAHAVLPSAVRQQLAADQLVGLRQLLTIRPAALPRISRRR